jgi:alpha-tubulin suppressor-like RCC1 family protein
VKTGTIRICVVLATFAWGGCGDETGPSVPDRLDFVVEPSDAAGGDAIAPAVVVAVRNEDGSTAAGWTGNVALSLEAGPGGAELRGLLETTAVGGTAVFDDLSLDVVSGGYRLTATSEDLEGAVSSPFAIHDVFRASAVTAGRSHSCALDEEGAAWCWGYNDLGQLGDGTRTASSLPVRVTGGLRFTELVSGSGHVCALATDGGVWCWGDGRQGQLGTGEQSESTSPVRVATNEQVVSLGGAWLHTCGVTATGGILCWGYNGTGQIGDGTSGAEDEADRVRAWPVRAESDAEFVDVSGGYRHTCGLTVEGRAICWGENYEGEVGDGTREMRALPTPVEGEHRFSALQAGGASCHAQTCGVTTDGSTYCWGRNYQRLVASSEHFLLTPTPLDGEPGFQSVSVGGYVVCGLTPEGELFCWGDGFGGQVGNGTVRLTQVPAPIRPDLRFASVKSGGFHTCAATVDGPVYCWGRNTEGQLGSGEGSLTGWTVPRAVWQPAG